MRELLEKFLDDDEDMHDMNLTAKEQDAQERELKHQQQEVRGLSSGGGAAAAVHAAAGRWGAAVRACSPSKHAPRAQLAALATRPPAQPARPAGAQADDASQTSYSSRSSHSSSDSDDEEVAEVEVLLEVYFMHIDNTFNRLQVRGRRGAGAGGGGAGLPRKAEGGSSRLWQLPRLTTDAAAIATATAHLPTHLLPTHHDPHRPPAHPPTAHLRPPPPTHQTHQTHQTQTLNEYIEDTEDLVNLKLDQHRNQLICIDLFLTAFTTCLTMVTCISGIFGMNLNSNLQDTDGVFSAVSIASCCAAVALFFLFVAFIWWKKLLVY
jgi:hypothetical protein